MFLSCMPIQSDRKLYIKQTREGDNPGSCMMVPTHMDGEHLVGVGHFGYQFNHCNMHLD